MIMDPPWPLNVIMTSSLFSLLFSNASGLMEEPEPMYTFISTISSVMPSPKIRVSLSAKKFEYSSSAEYSLVPPPQNGLSLDIMSWPSPIL